MTARIAAPPGLHATSKRSGFGLWRLAVGLAILLAGCQSAPRPADWQLEGKNALDRAVAAYLQGNSRLETLEMARARSALSSTGRPDLLARAELVRCASRVASLVFEPCAAFESLRQDAAPAERAYADYLAGSLAPGDVPLLPPGQRAVAAQGEGALAALGDPHSVLVAAAMLLQRGAISPKGVEKAVNAASAQGWRRPLMAWLGVQLALAEKAGDTTSAARLKRRMALLQAPVSR